SLASVSDRCVSDPCAARAPVLAVRPRRSSASPTCEMTGFNRCSYASSRLLGELMLNFAAGAPHRVGTFLGGLRQQATTGECTRITTYARESPSRNSPT